VAIQEVGGTEDIPPIKFLMMFSTDLSSEPIKIGAED
jgi:hypothetical protein